MPTWEWGLVIAASLAYLVVEAKVVRWALRRIATSDGARRSGTLQAALADEYVKDPERLSVDVRYFGFGVPTGLLLAAFTAANGHYGWTAVGVVFALFSFSGVGARATYGNLRFASIASFYADLLRRR